MRVKAGDVVWIHLMNGSALAVVEPDVSQEEVWLQIQRSGKPIFCHPVENNEEGLDEIRMDLTFSAIINPASIATITKVMP